MTGTAKTEEEEFQTIYNMKVVCIPTNRPVQRIDDTDLIFGTHQAKLKALVKEVEKRHAKGQPVLIGTVSVESNEEISALLTAAHIPHEVLNAKNQAREAEIISHAGEVGAVTLATNMAGRGTDIKLDDKVKELGGLCVLGTERHESRRIDNQLRGRSGRQGDPGYSRFFVSFDDELLRRFASPNIRNMIVNNLQDEAYENRMLMNAVTNAQKQIEGRNFDVRKNLKDYDDVLAKQRDIIYKKRDSILMADDIVNLIHDNFMTAGRYLANKAVDENSVDGLVSGDALKQLVEPKFLKEGSFNALAYDGSVAMEAGEDLGELLYATYLQKRKTWTAKEADMVERQLTLRVIDRAWQGHIDTMSHLREGINLRSYAQTNPLQDYVNEGYQMFKEMNEKVAVDVAYSLLNVQIRRQEEKPAEQPAEVKAADAPKAAETKEDLQPEKVEAKKE